VIFHVGNVSQLQKTFQHWEATTELTSEAVKSLIIYTMLGTDYHSHPQVTGCHTDRYFLLVFISDNSVNGQD